MGTRHLNLGVDIKLELEPARAKLLQVIAALVAVEGPGARVLDLVHHRLAHRGQDRIRDRAVRPVAEEVVDSVGGRAVPVGGLAGAAPQLVQLLARLDVPPGPPVADGLDAVVDDVAELDGAVAEAVLLGDPAPETAAGRRARLAALERLAFRTRSQEVLAAVSFSLSFRVENRMACLPSISVLLTEGSWGMTPARAKAAKAPREASRESFMMMGGTWLSCYLAAWSSKWFPRWW